MTTQTELPWIAEAKSLIGLREVVGVKHNPNIVAWLKDLKSAWLEDETPWCGTFIAHCLKTAGRSLPVHWYRAKAYLDYGTRLSKPAYGCIAIKSRVGGGHVFFVVGKTKDGYLVGLGGNQGNAVSLAKYHPSVIDGYVWPSKSDGIPSLPYPARFDLPVYNGSLSAVTSES